MNIVASALSMRDPDAPGLIWATEEAPDALHTLSLGELRREALRFSAALRKAGFSPGKADVELCRLAEDSREPFPGVLGNLQMSRCQELLSTVMTVLHTHHYSF